MTSKFTQKILDWTKLHPDYPSGAGELSRWKKESKKWRLIGTALEHYESRSSTADNFKTRTFPSERNERRCPK